MAGSNIGKKTILEALKVLASTGSIAKAELAKKQKITERTAQRIVKLFCAAHLSSEERTQGACTCGGEFGQQLKSLSDHQLEMIAYIIWEHQATLGAQDLKRATARRAGLPGSIREPFKSAMGLNTPSPMQAASTKQSSLPYEIERALQKRLKATFVLTHSDGMTQERLEAEVWDAREFGGRTYLLLRNPDYSIFTHGSTVRHIFEGESYDYGAHFGSFLDMLRDEVCQGDEPFWYMREVDLEQIDLSSVQLSDQHFERHEPLLELIQKRHGPSHEDIHMGGADTPIVFSLFGGMMPFFYENPHYLPGQKALNGDAYVQGEFSNALMPLWDVRNNMPELCPMDQEYLIERIEADLKTLKQKALGRYAPALWDGELYLSLPYLRKIPLQQMAQERFPMGWKKCYQKADALYQTIVKRSGALKAQLEELPIYLIDKAIAGVPLAQDFSGLVDLDQYQNDLWLEPSTRHPEPKPTGHAIVIDPLRLHNAARFVHDLYEPVLDATPEAIFETLLTKEVLLQAALYRLQGHQVKSHDDEQMAHAQAHRAALSLLNEGEHYILQAVAMQRPGYFFSDQGHLLTPGGARELSEEFSTQLSFLQVRSFDEELSMLERFDAVEAKERYTRELCTACERAFGLYAALDTIVQDRDYHAGGNLVVNLEYERVGIATFISRRIREESSPQASVDTEIERLLSEPQETEALKMLRQMRASRLSKECRVIENY